MPDLDYYLRKLDGLRRGPERPGPAPHKPCLLLAVLDLVEFGAVMNGRVEYAQILETGFFPTYFSKALGVTPQDPAWGNRYRPYYPFWYLQNDPQNERRKFWRLQPRPGRERQFNAMQPKVPTHRTIELNVAYAELDPDLFTLMLDSDSRMQIRNAILERYLAGTQIHALGQSDHRERIRRYIETSRVLRDPAFPRQVIRGYDGRCAATGERIVIPGADRSSRIALIEAAHLKPHAQFFDDDPRNGIALQPTYHRAMDDYLIAPGPDGVWRVSKTILRSDTETRLSVLHRKKVVLPEDAALQPREDCLQWRLNKFRERERARRG